MSGQRQFRLSVSALRALLEEPHNTQVEILKKAGDVEGIVEALYVDLEKGLSSNDVADLKQRVAVYGENRIPVAKSKSLFRLMWEALHDPILIILMIAGAVSLIIGMAFEEDKSHAWIEGGAILLAVIVVTLVASLNDWQKERQFKKLNAVKEDTKVSVLRDGHVAQVSKFDVVVGDVIILGQGDEIVADGLVVESSGLKVNEASLTGESDDIKKDRNSSPFVLSGTQVMDGIGRMVVLAVGQNSQTGIITALIQGKRAAKSAKAETMADVASTSSPADGKERSLVSNPDANVIELGETKATTHAFSGPAAVETNEVEVDSDEDEEELTILQKKLARLATLIGYLGLSVAILTVLVLVIRFCVENYSTRGFKKEDLREFLNYFIIGVTVVVVAIPEGLPLAVTLSLAFSMKKMLKDNNLVRHLDACETMGGATAVCSDKTGTLTTNRMTVVRAQLADTPTVDAAKSIADAALSPTVVICLIEGIALNSTAEVQRPESGVGLLEHVGSKTECALLQYAMENGYEYVPIRHAHKPLVLYPFNSARKSSGVVVATTLVDGQSGFRLHVKGASEIVLGRCTQIVMPDGSVRPLDGGTRQALLQKIESYAMESLRTLCLAYREFTVDRNWETVQAEEIDGDLVLIALVGIEDPLRPEVPGAIEKCRRAGITVRMVTGDNVVTATAIAKKCGILISEDDLVMEGPEFRKRVLDSNGNIIQSEVDKIWPRLRVLARSSPTDKYTLVSGMVNTKVNPQVVAVTGDGTNDAPALKRADVGFAMGIQGTAVAKNAADIIIMDDNFSSIVAAVKWGRNVYDSIAKFVQFQLTVNIVALVLAFTSACIVRQSPLTATQLLWINLVMDTLASLALATEKPTEALLDRKPYGRNKSLISRRMWVFTLGHAVFQMILLFTLTFAGHKFFDISNGKGQDRSVHYTIVFNTFALCQFFNEVNARKLHGELNVFKGFLSNKYFLAIMCIQFGVQILIVQFGSRAFNVMGLTAGQWAWCFLFACLEIPYNVLLGCLPKIIPKSWKVSMSRPMAKSWWVNRATRVRRAFGFKPKYRESPCNSINAECGDDVLLVSSMPYSKVVHNDMYEATLFAMLANTKSPSTRLRTAARIVCYRQKCEFVDKGKGPLL